MDERRALLLTDVVDSTLLAERLGDAAAAELGAAHDRIARDLLRDWHGREIDKTDGMLMLFDNATDALGYAVAYHAALTTLPVPLKARAGLHVGTLILRSNPPDDVARGAKPLEVEGIAKPVAARVMSLALGGQTLLSAEARAGLGETALRVQSHGFWRIKGIAEPVELFEAGDERAPFTPPPDSAKVYRVVRRDDLWLPLREVPHRLPAERDDFVGRQDALAELALRFDRGARLVSLLGVGGSGKTRLATRFARSWMGDFPGGVWFCDLTAARGVDGIVQAVAQALDVPLSQDDPVRQLGRAIAARGSCLLVLDNFEQVSRHAEATLGCWLDHAAGARFLVTSREVLGLPGEQVFALAPLAAADAQALFTNRAAAANRDYRPDTEDMASVPQLVGLLDGLPLAIELAAARVRALPPRTLLARMGQRFKVLVAAGRRRDRQATLRAAFDWSWDLLSDAEKAALAQLSVFKGGFTLEAAETVIDLSSGGVAGDTLDLLQSLIDKSFVRPLDGARYDLLVSVQEYSAEHLCTPGRYPGSGAQALRAAHARHGAYYATRTGQAHGDGSDRDLDNLLVACRRAAGSGKVPVAVATLEAAWHVLRLRGPFGAGADLAMVVSGMPAMTAAERSRVAYVAGSALDASGKVDDAMQMLQLALGGARDAADRQLEAQALCGLGDLLSNQARFDESLAYHSVALDIARQLGAVALECGALNGLGSACVDLGRLDDARKHYLAALQTARAHADPHWECAALCNLGGLCFDQGQSLDAARYFQEGLTVARGLGHRTWEGNALCNLGALDLSRGRLQEAIADLQAALDLARAIGHVRLTCVVECNLGLAHFGLQDWPRALAHYEAALALSRELSDRRSEGLFLGYLGQLQARLGRFAEAASSIDAGERLLEQVADRFSLGLLLCHRAEAEHLAGRAGSPTVAWLQAKAIEEELGAGTDSELGVAIGRVGALLGTVPGGGAAPSAS